MQSILKFNLPEDNEEFQMSINGHKYHCAINDILQHLRDKIKYSDLNENELKVYEDIRIKIFEILDEYNLNNNF
jgi:hypothetical protein